MAPRAGQEEAQPSRLAREVALLRRDVGQFQSA